MSVDANSQSFKEDMIAEIKRIQEELNELKNIKKRITKKSMKRKYQKQKETLDDDSLKICQII
ncbi:hypothetical protein NKOR_03010 [Candidatus Nitrosopumilus koreensis AR1]|uniref:Uncharacterized protein n=1 Tax=Candidatus Nitrosopumilus koreensis AR1 TaxID=1229908 RepID=K0B7R4_9ARCH|nr:hypothetical protein [Candidatus Nitrosopumilus koreensis]AFS80496.1 hypothetical protein NKOR_03010 [Candidatus Nitrosopumilus koreensis AR1]